jgi:tetratricopeptide (TPR) repeat protein
MKTRGLLTFAVLLMAASSAWAFDTVRKTDGKTVNGTLKGVTDTEVQIEKQAGSSESIPLSDVDVIFYDGEPGPLRTARTQAASGNFQAAITGLAKLDVASAKPEVKAEAEYYTLFSKAKLALATRQKEAIDDAGKKLFTHLQANPKSYHRLPANELLGDLAVAGGNYAAAATFYQVLEASPFPEYKMRAGVANGRALVAQGNYADAQRAFDAVLALASKGTAPTPSQAQQQLAATLGKAVCLAADSKFDESIKLVQDVINGSNPEDGALQAQAYLTLGNCYLKKPDAQKPALLAFLHVDVLYPQYPREHAEALKHLAKLWNDLGKPERATACTDTLKARYGLAPGAQ